MQRGKAQKKSFFAQRHPFTPSRTELNSYILKIHSTLDMTRWTVTKHCHVRTGQRSEFP